MQVDPLELAREIVAGGFGQAHTYFDLFRNARAVAEALIRREEGVEPTKIGYSQQLARYRGLCQCGVHVVSYQNYCFTCGHRLKWNCVEGTPDGKG